MAARRHPSDFLLPYGAREIPVRARSGRLTGVFSPNAATPARNPVAEVRRALEHPIGTPKLREAGRGCDHAVIVTDDITRQTPLRLILPELLDEFNAAGVLDDQITVLIALGTHRAMTEREIEARFGAEVKSRVQIVNHPWEKPQALVDLGVTPNGTPVRVCRLAMEADLLIGVGSVVPHHIPGYSGGAKIIQPGVTGAETTGDTHLLSTRSERTCLGTLENPVRREMEAIARQVGLSAVLNCVLDSKGALVRAFYGTPRDAFRAAAGLSKEVYGVVVPACSDIVVASSHPCDLEFWQAHKTLYPADLIVREGGTLVVATPCPEGVAVTHREVLDYAGLSSEKILAMIEKRVISDRVSGALALAWAKVRERASIFLVSDGIKGEEARALGFTTFESVQDALDAALGREGAEATIAVLTHAPETLPILVQ